MIKYLILVTFNFSLAISAKAQTPPCSYDSLWANYSAAIKASHEQFKQTLLDQSGTYYCNITFNVDENGLPVNIDFQEDSVAKMPETIKQYFLKVFKTGGRNCSTFFASCNRVENEKYALPLELADKRDRVGDRVRSSWHAIMFLLSIAYQFDSYNASHQGTVMLFYN